MIIGIIISIIIIISISIFQPRSQGLCPQAREKALGTSIIIIIIIVIIIIIIIIILLF